MFRSSLSSTIDLSSLAQQKTTSLLRGYESNRPLGLPRLIYHLGLVYQPSFLLEITFGFFVRAGPTWCCCASQWPTRCPCATAGSCGTQKYESSVPIPRSCWWAAKMTFGTSAKTRNTWLTAGIGRPWSGERIELKSSPSEVLLLVYFLLYDSFFFQVI